jgi:hypothetical protein
MIERYRQQSMGLDVLKPNDTTLWKRALKSKPRQTASQKKLVFAHHPTPGILTIILNYLKKHHVDEKHHRG